MPKQLHDFTKGNILQQLIVFSGPIILANFLQSSYQFVDMLWVGNLLGDHSLGAVAISSTILFTTLSFCIGINNASLTILSQQKGRGDYDGLKRYLNGFVVVLGSLSIFLGSLGYFFSEELLNFMNTPLEMKREAMLYLQINFLGILFLFGYNFISTIMRALGDSKTPLKIVALAVSLNIFFDPIFILTFGITGAAIATILSQGTAFIIGLIIVLRKKLAPLSVPFLPKREEVGLILKLGIPAGLQMSVISAGSMAIMTVVTSFGPAVVSGYGAAQRLDSLIIIPAQAVGVAVNSMAGQNMGIGNVKRVFQIAKIAVLYIFSIMLTIGLIVMALSRFGIALFIQEEEALLFGSNYLKWVALCYPFLGINFVLNGIVRASGAMYQVLMLNILSFWVLRFPLAKLFSNIFGEIGIAIGIGSSLIISSLLAYLYFQFGKWKEKVLFKESKEKL